MRQFPEPDPQTTRRLVAHLRRISAQDWYALASRLDSLRGDDIGDVWRRAKRRAQWMAPVVGKPGDITRTLFALGELLGEFKPPRSRAEDGEAYRALIQRTPPGARREHLVAASELHDLVISSCPGDRVLLEMVLLTAHLAAYRAGMTDELVREQYAFLEPLLPFAELTAA